MRLNVKACALTGGVLWSISLFVMTWWLIVRGGAEDVESLIGHFYLGYSVSPVGSVIGLGWALVDGLVGGAVVAWVYNLFVGPAGAPSDAATSGASDPAHR